MSDKGGGNKSQLVPLRRTNVFEVSGGTSCFARLETLASSCSAVPEILRLFAVSWRSTSACSEMLALAFSAVPDALTFLGGISVEI